MKRLYALLLAAVLCLPLAACGGGSGSSAPQPTSSTPSQQLESSKPASATMTREEFETLLTQLPLHVTSTKYTVQDEQYKSLYPDMLQAKLQNDSGVDIKSAVIAFAAWDANGLPVKIKGSIDFSDGTYIKQVDYSDINLAAGGSFGDSYGFGISEDCSIKDFVATPVSFETFEGDAWENPYFDEWCVLFEGVKLANAVSVEVTIDNSFFTPSAPASESTAPSGGTTGIQEEDLLSKIAAQEFRVTSTKYVVQDEQYKSLYPDMLQAKLQNDSDADIKSAVIAFAAWDTNGLPVKIKGSIDFSDGAYIKQVDYSDINLAAGGSFGDNYGFEISEECSIKDFVAIVLSYETFEGETWENPLFDDWCTLYEGQKHR